MRPARTCAVVHVSVAMDYCSPVISGVGLSHPAPSTTGAVTQWQPMCQGAVLQVRTLEALQLPYWFTRGCFTLAMLVAAVQAIPHPAHDIQCVCVCVCVCVCTELVS